MVAQEAVLKKEVRKSEGKTIRVVKKRVSKKKLREAGVISASDAEMDSRARSAIEAAIKKNKICGKPVARYDVETGKAYLEYSDGRKEEI